MSNNSRRSFMDLLGDFFTEYLPITMNASTNTIQSYKCAFRLLFLYLSTVDGIKVDHITFEALTFVRLSGFFDWLVNERGNGKTTAKQRMGALASFAEYAQYRCIEAGYAFRNNLKNISRKTLRRAKGKQRFCFTREELSILFSLPDTTLPLEFRDFVILTVMYASGARAQEICDLIVSSVTFNSKGVIILALVGKGNKTRRVTLTSAASDVLKKYLQYRRITDKPSAHIFPTQRNEQISVACIEEIFEKYVNRAKAQHPDMFLKGSYTPHVMRHTTASHMIEAGMPMTVVKNILGHASIQSTQVYVDINQQAVDKSITEWNKKWFHSDNSELSAPQKDDDSFPDFLK